MSSIIKVDQIQTAAGGVPTAADLGLNVSGTVLQVVHARYDTQVSISGTAWTSTGLTATITPTSTTSQILIMVFQQVHVSGGSSTEGGCGFMVSRNGTTVSSTASATSFDMYHYDASVGNDWRGRIPYSGIDSPASTSALTYTANVVRYGVATAGLSVQDNNNPSFMILQEIAG